MYNVQCSAYDIMISKKVAINITMLIRILTAISLSFFMFFVLLFAHLSLICCFYTHSNIHFTHISMPNINTMDFSMLLNLTANCKNRKKKYFWTEHHSITFFSLCDRYVYFMNSIAKLWWSESFAFGCTFSCESIEYWRNFVLFV